MSRRTRARRPLLVAALALSTAAGALSLGAGAQPAGAAAAPPPTGCATTTSTTQTGYLVADPACDYSAGAGYTGGRFTPTLGAGGQVISRTLQGVSGGAAYRMEVPLAWNHEVVVFAHGYRGTGNVVYVDNPDLRYYYLARGFAWVASSYQTNGYDIGHGVTDSHAALGLFGSLVGKPKDAYMSGLSMGGGITVTEIEQYRGDYVGAMPYCGALGDTTLFDYFNDANVTAAALTQTPVQYPGSAAAGVAYIPAYDAAVKTELPKLGTGFGTGDPGKVVLSPLGETWGDAVMQRSGGTRPGFDSALAYWGSFGFTPLTDAPFLFGVNPALSGGTIGIAGGNVVDNEKTFYRLGEGGPATNTEKRLNNDVLRVQRTAIASTDLSGVPKVSGTPGIPVLSLHGVGDLFVPYSMEQVYAARVARNGQQDNVVSRAVRENGHCEYTQSELRTSFDALVRWVHTKQRPAGDDVLNAAVVAGPTYGCAYTDPSPTAHPTFHAAVPCPAVSTPTRPAAPPVTRRG